MITNNIQLIIANRNGRSPTEHNSKVTNSKEKYQFDKNLAWKQVMAHVKVILVRN